MFFAISTLIYFASVMHNFTGHHYAVSCAPPHTACSIIDESAHNRPIFTGAIHANDPYMPWLGTQAATTTLVWD